jgi:hypothetical protein
MPLAQGDKALQCRVYAPVGSPARGGVLSFLIAAIDRRNAGRPAFAWALLCSFSSYGKDWRVFLAGGNTVLLKEFLSAVPVVKGPRSRGRNNNAQVDSCC